MDGELVAWSQLAVPCNAACNPIYPKLQLHVSQATTLCIPGCNPMRPRLQPYASQAATLCISGELDDSRLVEAAAGERFVFKRRGRETEAPRGEQESYLVITPRRRYGGGSRRGHRDQWRSY